MIALRESIIKKLKMINDASQKRRKSLEREWKMRVCSYSVPCVHRRTR